MSYFIYVYFLVSSRGRIGSLPAIALVILSAAIWITYSSASAQYATSTGSTVSKETVPILLPAECLIYNPAGLLNVRDNPLGNILTQASNGKMVTLSSTSRDSDGTVWGKITGTYQGWVNMKFLACLPRHGGPNVPTRPETPVETGPESHLSFSSNDNSGSNIDCKRATAPIERMICGDHELTILDVNAHLVFTQILLTLGADDSNSALAKNQHKWLVLRGVRCRLPPGSLSAEQALIARPCLVALYRDRIAELSQRSPSMLHARPARLSNKTAYFTTVGSFLTAAEAKSQFELLRHKFLTLKFEVYPPYGGQTYWTIMFASYTDIETAQAARGIASSSGIATDAFVLRIADRLDEAEEWKPATPEALAFEVAHAANNLTKSIIECYNSGNNTVRTMYSCSGKWLSPKAFLFCVLDAGCPAYPDTLAGRANLAAALGSDQLNTPLAIDAANLPKLPTAQQINGCQVLPGATQETFQSCVLNAMGTSNAGSVNLILGCVQGKLPQDAATCLAGQAQNSEISGLVTCMAGKPPTPESVSSCLGNTDVAAQIINARNCITSLGKSLQECIVPQLPSEQAKMVDCISRNGRDGLGAADCLASLNPAFKDEICAAKASTAAQAAACLAPHLGTDAAKIAICVAGKKDDVVTCLAGDRPEYRAAQQAYNCIANGRDASSFVENCASDFIKDEKTRHGISCIAKAEGDRDQLAACAAESVLPPQLARYASCAATSDGATSFALCAAGPLMNEEWRIAAECAVETGGNPVGWAGCTAGRLTLRELTKCLTGQIGKDCFGPNNTIRKTLDDAFNDLTHGPGKNNEIVKAIDHIGEVTGGPNSVVNNPGQILGGPNSIFHNPGQLAGGPNSFVNQVIHPQLPSLPTVSVGGVPVKVDANPLRPGFSVGNTKVEVDPNPAKPHVRAGDLCLGWGC